MSRFNNWLARNITSGVATMYCAYAFACLALYGFPIHDLKPTTVIQWVSQEFLQLVLLSVIMVGQKVQGDKIQNLHEDVHKHHAFIRKHLEQQS